MPSRNEHSTIILIKNNYKVEDFYHVLDEGRITAESTKVIMNTIHCEIPKLRLVPAPTLHCLYSETPAAKHQQTTLRTS
jgi:hypothetical protein